MSPSNLGVIASQISGHLWQPSGAYDSIASTTVGAGGSSSIIFDNVPQTYTHLQLRFSGRSTASANTDLFYFWNAPSGITTAQWHVLTGDGSAINGGAGTAAVYGGKMPAATSSANIFGATIVDILDYSNSNKLKTFRSLSGSDLNGSGAMELWSGVWSGANTAISSIRLNCGSGGFAQYTTVGLYGIKGN